MAHVSHAVRHQEHVCFLPEPAVPCRKKKLLFIELIEHMDLRYAVIHFICRASTLTIEIISDGWRSQKETDRSAGAFVLRTG